MEEFDFSLPGADEHSRRAYRTCVPGLEAYVHERGRAYVVKDLSAMGMGMQVQDKDRFTVNETFTCDLMLNKKTFLTGIRATVMRIAANNLAGCNFEAMDKRMEARLDKLVLEVQKRLISLRKAQREEE